MPEVSLAATPDRGPGSSGYGRRGGEVLISGRVVQDLRQLPIFKLMAAVVNTLPPFLCPPFSLIDEPACWSGAPPVGLLRWLGGEIGYTSKQHCRTINSRNIEIWGNFCR